MKRKAFTLTELLVVLIIVLILAAVVIPLALRLNEGSRLRDGARTVQAALNGARDRAMARRAPVGIRLITDDNNRSFVRSLAYIVPAAPLTEGRAIVVHSHPAANWPTVVTAVQASEVIFNRAVLLGADKARFQFLPRFQRPAPFSDTVIIGSIRLDNSGAVYGFMTNDALLDIANAGTPAHLILDKPFLQPVPFGSTFDITVAGTPYYNPTVSNGVEYEIPLGNILLANNDPIPLPSGIIIDLGFMPDNPSGAIDDSSQRLTRLEPSAPNGTGFWDILFAPNGQVIGTAAEDPHIVLWLRETTASVDIVNTGVTTQRPTGFQKLIPTTGAGLHTVVGVYSRTGYARSIEPNFEITTAAVAGYYDHDRLQLNFIKESGTGL